MDLDKRIRTYQEQLSDLFGISGFEEEVSNFIFNEIENNNLADEVYVDSLGNVLATINGKEENERILFDAHTDEIGLMVSHITKKGFIKFILIGGWDNRILPGQCIILRSTSGKKYHGIIGSKPPHLSSIEERKKKLKTSDLYIDLGMESEIDAIEHDIEIGCVGTLYDPFMDFPNGMVRGKAFDDRTGCNVLLQLMYLLKENPPKDTILFNFAVQEEVGMRGAATGAYSLKPTLGIAIENTTAGDVPEIEDSECPVYIGKGPAITIADHSIITSSYLNKRLSNNAELQGIPYQYKKPMYGKTDAGSINLTRKGVPSTVVSVPCRYIHSPTSLLKLDDLKNTILMSEAFIKNSAKVKKKKNK